ncbi:MAG: primosomal protein N' [bacterium]
MTSLFGQPDPAAPPPRPGPGSRFASVVLHRGIEHTPAKSSAPPAARPSHRSAPPSSTSPGAPDAAFTYFIPAGMPEPLPGQLVRVPLGKANTPTSGIVLQVGDAALLGDLPPAKAKPILELTPARINPDLLALAQWLATYYVCPLGMVLQTMLPAAVKKQIGRKRILRYTPLPPSPTTAPAEAALTKPLRAALARLRALPESDFPAEPAALRRLAAISSPSVKRLHAAGLLTESADDTVSARAGAFGEEASTPPPDANAAPAPPAPRLTPTPDQARALASLVPALGSFSAHLLRGITGSGKTEVYLRLIEHLLAARPSATAIVLVPEIALTPQTSRRFLDRFGSGSVAVLHSGLTQAQRNAQWTACAKGQVRVVVGARSAVFAPVPTLGLVIVDEEHDSSYKQDQLPRYHARDVAVKRAHLANCPVLLGSATPSLESWANTRPHSPSTPRARYHLHELTTRAGNARLPEVRIVDLLDERRARAQQPGGWRDRHLHLLGPTLEKAIARTLADRGQVMLLLNRRGYANYISCPDPNCGWVMHCNHCDATVVYHKAAGVDRSGVPIPGGFVRCHHCLAELLLPTACPTCARRPNTFGLGTQRVEEELQRKFLPDFGITIGQTLLRLDADTMTTGADYFHALDRFAKGEVRILLGTQMIAKGLDFPNVALVGVINADTALSLPDFRAAERTFQLVCQVAGRAGRADRPGLVIVQTASPTAEPIVLAAAHDYTTFANNELACRAAVGLPPIGRMARIVCRDRDLDRATAHAADLAHALTEARDALPDPQSVRIRGPMPCPISRIDDHHRQAIELLSSSRGTLQGLLAGLRAQGLLLSDTHTAIDVDPIALL